jgi:predicted Zn-ribbon and HTH transcriptional regulator
MKSLEKYLIKMDGSWGCRANYEKELRDDSDKWAWLSGHYCSLLDDAIKLLGGKERTLEKIKAYRILNEQPKEQPINIVDKTNELAKQNNEDNKEQPAPCPKCGGSGTFKLAGMPLEICDCKKEEV